MIVDSSASKKIWIHSNVIKYKQVLFQIQEGKGQTVEISGEYRDAIEERRREFKSFESDFKVGHPQSSIKKNKNHSFFIMLHLLSLCSVLRVWLCNQDQVWKAHPEGHWDHEQGHRAAAECIGVC